MIAQGIAQALRWLSLYAVADWPATVLLAVAIWQRGQIRSLRGDSDAWYTLWVEKCDQLAALRQRLGKARG